MRNWLWSAKSHGHTEAMYQPGAYNQGVPAEDCKHGLVYACYQRLLRERNIMDFDDILALVSSGLAGPGFPTLCKVHCS